MQCQPSPKSKWTMLSLILTFARTHDCDITEQYVDWGKYYQLYLHEGSTFATPSEQYVDWDNNTNFIFMRDQNSPPPMTNVERGDNINLIFMRDQNQEGGTSTPGKRPGCSEHVLLNNCEVTKKLVAWSGYRNRGTWPVEGDDIRIWQNLNPPTLHQSVYRVCSPKLVKN